MAWLWIVEGTRPDRWDVIGMTICLVGSLVILLPARAWMATTRTDGPCCGIVWMFIGSGHCANGSFGLGAAILCALRKCLHWAESQQSRSLCSQTMFAQNSANTVFATQH